MTSFVLVHGSWHGAWCWHKVRPRLEAAGHEVVAPDLPGHGVDMASPTAVSFDDYVGRVCDAIDRAPGAVALVGHSMGGHVVTQATEDRADTVETLVYLSAFLPADGQALTDLHVSDQESMVAEAVTVDEAAGVVHVDPAVAVEAFYHDCSAADVALCQSLLRPEPIEPRTVPVALSEGAYGSVPRVYIECTEDRALPPTFQRELREAVPCGTVRSLATSHSPFLSAPGALADLLLAAADG